MSEPALKVVAGELDIPRELAVLHEAARSLAVCRNLDEIKQVRDQAAALRHYVKQRNLGLDAQNSACEIKLRAERRAGELLEELPGSGRPRKNSHDESFSPSLSELGINHNQSYRWQLIASLDPERFESYIASTCDAGKELTSAGALKLAKQQAAQTVIDVTPPGPEAGDIVGDLQTLIDAGRTFTTIYADPPWRYRNQKTRGSTDNHYPTMTVEEICAEPVGQIAAEDAHLHLWTTNGFLVRAFDVMQAWGFTYASCFVWVKPQMGMGNYWRIGHEFLLLGVRGSLPFKVRDAPSWGEFNRGKHSAKPEAIREIVERVSPGPYLEMYGRQALPGTEWTVYGNQVRPGSRRLLAEISRPS